MKRLVGALLLAMVCQSALTYTAEASPRHHHRHHAKVAAERESFPTLSSFVSASSDLVQRARSYLGAGPEFGRANLWCARFVNVVLKQTGRQGTGSDQAASFAQYGHPVSGPRVGAIAVMSRRGGGHVGIVAGVDAQGNPILISGNNGNRVREAVYPRSRVYAYRMP